MFSVAFQFFPKRRFTVHVLVHVLGGPFVTLALISFALARRSGDCKCACGKQAYSRENTGE
jgi:hypothetical protein